MAQVCAAGTGWPGASKHAVAKHIVVWDSCVCLLRLAGRGPKRLGRYQAACWYSSCAMVCVQMAPQHACPWYRPAVPIASVTPASGLHAPGADQDIGLQAAGDLLAERFGSQFKVFWAVGLLASGQASAGTAGKAVRCGCTACCNRS